LTARAHDAGVALILLDLDRFKEINDALGHHLGDQLLRKIGPRLQTELRAQDIIARLGGDEFAIVPRGTNAQVATAAAAKLLTALRQPFDVEGLSLHADASIGIAVCPDHGTSGAALLQRADVAMYRAKAARRGWQLYAFEPHENARDRLQTTEDLRLALAHGELVLHYQPKLQVRAGTVVGVEALVRWPHSGRGLVYPDVLVPLAEQTGLMRSVTSIVLKAAIQQCSEWRRAGMELSIAVNLSMADLIDMQLPTEIGNLLATFDLPSRALELEVTESTLMIDIERSQAVLEMLRTLGVQLAVDDYGTGYSSLAYLQQFPVDELKLDKSFVLKMGEEPSAAAIVQSTIDLAHRLGLRIVAEGVETQAQLRELDRLGCDVAQGFYISRPVPAAEATAWLRSRMRTAPASTATGPALRARG
jgi:diguanylate cyclase (GGDEF)-like protein